MQKDRLRLALAGGGLVIGAAYLLTRPARAGAASPASPISASPPGPPAVTTAPISAIPAPKPSIPLVDRVEAAIKQEVPVGPKSETPASIRALATHLVTICQEQQYPLDLAFGHCFVESALALNAYNPSSGARGPLQVTEIACRDIGVAWPIPLGQAATLRAGIRYMKLLRSRHPECAASVKVTLQHYGLGRGNWIKLSQNGCGPNPCTNRVSVWREECGCGRGYSTRAIAIAKRHPELKTVAWWG